LIIQGILALLVLASLVVAYLSAKTWHWAHVLVVLGVFLSAVAFLFLASETLRINGVWRSQTNQLNKQLADTQTRIEALRTGTDDSRLMGTLAADGVQVPEEAEQIPSAGDLDHQLHMEIRVRGRVWRDVQPTGVNPQSGEVHATVETPKPSGIQPDTILFVFEQGEPTLPDPTQGPQYLGEFRVTGAVDQEMTLEPVLPMDEFELQRLAGSQGPWILYESMPVDRYTLFADKTEEELRKLLPEDSVQEYIRQGTPAGPDDDEWHRVGYDEEGNQLGPYDLDKAVRVEYRRRLRDYTTEFEELTRERVILLTDVAAVRQDNERLQAALISAKELEAFREEELRKLGIDLAGITKEREAIEAHLATVEKQLANARRLLDETLRENSRLANQLAALQDQLKATIDQKSSDAEPTAGPLALSASG
jgi:hypothetical protein